MVDDTLSRVMELQERLDLVETLISSGGAENRDVVNASLAQCKEQAVILQSILEGGEGVDETVFERLFEVFGRGCGVSVRHSRVFKFERRFLKTGRY